MKDGDYIVAINEEDVKWSPHDQVVGLIKRSGNALKMRLITPLDSKKENSHNNHSSLVTIIHHQKSSSDYEESDCEQSSFAYSRLGSDR